MPSPITCLRADHPSHTPVPADVLVECQHGRIVFTFADGVELDFDERELLTTIEGAVDAWFKDRRPLRDAA